MDTSRLLAMTAVAGLGLALTTAPAAAQDSPSDDATVTFEVEAVSVISISGDPAKLTIDAAVAGSAPGTATNAATTYSVTTNESSRKITGEIDTAMPAGVTLSVELAAPTGSGATEGMQSLSATPVDLVTGISTLNESGLAITYQLEATSAAGPVGESTRTVTFTITGD